MRIRLSIPLDVYLTAASLDQLSPSLSFVHEGCTVNLSLKGESPLAHEGAEVTAAEKHFRRIRAIELTLQDQGDGPLTTAVTSDDRPTLVKLLTRAVNRVLRSVRNFGTLTNVREVRTSDEAPNNVLLDWGVAFSNDGDTWSSFVKEDGLTLADMLAKRMVADLRRRTLSQPTASFAAGAWPEITEAIQDNVSPAPEREFLTNSIEHLRVGNLRLAVLEAVVCLEIVVSQFLRAHFELNRGWSKSRLGKYLNPDISLATRVGLLLEMLLSEEDLKAIDGESVRAGIAWRNKAVHETGHLPPDVPEKDVRRVISAVLGLALRLGQKRDALLATPENREVARLIAEKHGIAPPAITVLSGRIRAVRFRFFQLPFPNEGAMGAIAVDLAQEFAARDNRFQPNDHLHVWFEQFMTPVALWTGGKLSAITKPPEGIPGA